MFRLGHICMLASLFVSNTTTPPEACGVNWGLIGYVAVDGGMIVGDEMVADC